VTRDGGASWKPDTSINRALCDGSFITSAPNVVWLNFSHRTDDDSLYRSTDGGKTFHGVGKVEGLENNVCEQLSVDPFDNTRASIAFNSIYTFDAVTRSVTTSMCCGTLVVRIAYSPVDHNVVFVYAITR